MDKLLRLKGKNGQRGFSLVELMVVVAIIGILAALAVPRFQMFQAKARQSEAKNNLSHIYTLQESYYGDNETYGNVDSGPASCPSKPGLAGDIGFRVSPCKGTSSKVRYSYTSAPTGTGWNATAKAAPNIIVPGCAVTDTWTIDEDKSLEATENAVQKCK